MTERPSAFLFRIQVVGLGVYDTAGHDVSDFSFFCPHAGDPVDLRRLGARPSQQGERWVSAFSFQQNFLYAAIRLRLTSKEIAACLSIKRSLLFSLTGSDTWDARPAASVPSSRE